MDWRSSARDAVRLAQDGRSAEAIGLLDRAAAADDADALLLLALWRIEGRLLPRDLPLARDGLDRAQALGHAGAARTYAGFVAAGVGGPRNWAATLALLGAWRERDPVAQRQLALIGAMALDDNGDPVAVAEGETLCESPEVRRFPGLLTADECAFLTESAQPRFKPALIFHEGQQKFVSDPLRNSDAAGFPIAFEWPAVHALNRRLATASDTDVAQGETLQILRYAPGQEYRVHLDAIPGLVNQRVLTFLVYLNDGYQGGETEFTEAGLSVRGRRGDGLLFRNALADGRPDPRARHAGRPVLRGTKLVASRWIRARPAASAEGFGRQEVEEN